MSGRLVLDSNVLIDIDRGDREAWRRLKRFVELRGVPIVPTVALAQAWRGAVNARLGQALALCTTVPLDEATARRAGALCARAGTRDVVDAAIVATASDHGGYVWSEDPDLRALAAHLPPEMDSVVVRVPD